ncbi:hypothetical protein Q1695_000338 [Nippostrongylus brasiliensis]|nr:hypothetical protein Q1695_000338 [Nippostrongylus brasiliensis]
MSDAALGCWLWFFHFSERILRASRSRCIRFDKVKKLAMRMYHSHGSLLGSKYLNGTGVWKLTQIFGSYLR